VHHDTLTLVRFGLFDWVDANPRFAQLADTYEQRLRVVEYADRVGYWAYHVAEHHGTPLGMAPSPSLLLASAAQRTQHIRLGPMVFLLPLYHPVRLAQEISMLDHLTRGRLELGVGRGASPYELALFDVRADDTRAMFDEALQLVLDGLRTGRMHNPDGRWFKVGDAQLVLQPWQRPYPPVWYPTSNPETIPWLARQGINLLMSWNLPPGLEVGDQVANYQRVWQAHREDPQRINAHVPEPRLGIVRHILVAETDTEALRIAREAWHAYFDNYNYLWALHDNRRHERQRDLQALVEAQLVFVGSPETVRQRVQAEIDGSGCNYFACSFSWGSLSTEQMLRSLDLFTREVRDRIVARAGGSVRVEESRSRGVEESRSHVAKEQIG
jgi:alkanesulfonate monooxygenase SsuD/methylene tetrahydromethanopterin reductase-like flavin-dependent oxidoreductase (luciferase family)